MINYPADWTKINPNIPFIGQWKAKVTHIDQMWYQPCGVTPTLMALGAFAALPELVFGLLQPDCLDYTYDRVGRPHRRRRRPTFQLESWASPLAAPKGGVGWAMWHGAALAQKVGFYSLVVDSFANWIIAGTSMAFYFAGCDDPNQGHATSNCTDTVPALFPAGVFTFGNWSVQSSHIFVADSGSIACPPGHQAGCGFSLTQNLNTIPGLPDCTFTAHLFDAANAWRGAEVEQYLDTNNKFSITYANGNSEFNAGGHSFRVRVTKSEGVMNVTGTFTAGGVNIKGLNPSACGHSLKAF